MARPCDSNRSFFLSALAITLISFSQFSVTALAATSDVDFAQRCAQPGVIKCVGFDQPADIAGKWGENSGILPGATTPALDTTIKASGGSSLKFTIPSNSPADTSGSYFTNFSSDLKTQFDENSEFFVQWRQRFSPEFVSTYYKGDSGIKQAIITTGDQPGKIYNSCESIGVVVTTYYQNRFTGLYQSCTGSASHPPYDLFEEPINGPGGWPVDYKLQNARPWPYCLYTQKTSSYFPPSGNCFGWVANEWMTFQIRIKTGPRVGDEFVNSYVDLWIAREGKPSEHVIKWGPYNLSAGWGEKYGKVWLTPYQTTKDPSHAHPTAYTWYDELIISRTMIADPSDATAPPPSDGPLNVAAQINGGVATASSTYNGGFAASGVINGDRKGINWGQGGGWNDATAAAFPDWVQVNFKASSTIEAIDVFTVQDNYVAPAEPTLSMAFTQWGITDFQVQYWSGSAWLDVPGGNVTNNASVWRRFSFPAITTDRIRVLVNGALNGHARITEVEAWTTAAGAPNGGNQAPTVSLSSPANGTTLAAPATVNLAATAGDPDGQVTKVELYRNGALIATAPPSASNSYTYDDSNVPAGTYTYTVKVYDNATPAAVTTSEAKLVTVTAESGGAKNVAAQANGGVASASSSHSAAFPASGANNGDRKGVSWGSGGGWNDATPGAFPDWLRVDFSGPRTIGEIDVFTVQDDYVAPAEPTPNMTFTKYGITDFQVVYWNGSGWAEVPGGDVTGNNLVWRKFTFEPITTTAVGVIVKGALGSYARVTEIEAWTAVAPPLTVTLNSSSKNAMLTAPATVNLSAAATVANGTVSKVEFYRDSALIGTVTTPSSGTTSSGIWTYSDANRGVGTYKYSAKVYDNATPNATVTSMPALVSVTGISADSKNVAAQAYGGVASASTTYSAAFPASGANNGERKGLNWGNGGGWNNAVPGTVADWLKVTFSTTQTIGQIDVFTVQDTYDAPAEPTPSMTFTKYGIADFQVVYWNGSDWAEVPGGNVTGNDFVWRRFTFAPITTNAVGVIVNRGLGSYARVTEIEAWTNGAPAVAEPPKQAPVVSQPGQAPAPGIPNPVFDAVPTNTAVYIGGQKCTPVDGEYAEKCKIATDYSGMVFDGKRRQMVLFGGGHASTNYDAVNTLDLNTLTWTEKYKPTDCASMQPGNYDYTTGAWRSGPSGPYPRAASRHTYDLMVIPDDLDELILLTYVEGNGTCPGMNQVYAFWSAAKVPHYNFITNEWTFTDADPEMQFSAAEFDPVSKKVIILGTDGLKVYDPVTKVKATAIDLYGGTHVRDENGALLATASLMYANQLVYYPPNQKMYYFERYNKRVFEITLDRSDFSKSTIQRLVTTGTQSPHHEPGYAYDSVNGIIGGGVYNNNFYAFDPMTRTWTSSFIQGGAPGNQAFHALNYDPVNNMFIFVTEQRQTWGYRYKAQ